MNENLKWQSGNYTRSKPRSKADTRPYAGTPASEASFNKEPEQRDGDVDGNVALIVPGPIATYPGETTD